MNSLLLLLACPKEAPPPVPEVPVAAVVAPPPATATKPGPLPRPAFNLPSPSEGTLANGMRVIVAENHELPIVEVRFVFDVGNYASSVPGLPAATMDMLNEGAAGKDSVALSNAARAIAADLNTGAGSDSAWVSTRALKKNIAPALDLTADVMLRPDFPKAEWERLKIQYEQGLRDARTDPGSLAWRATRRLLFGFTYEGNFMAEGDINTYSPLLFKKWWTDFITPDHGVVVVGGDTTVAEIVPLLDARFSGWKKKGKVAKPAVNALPINGTDVTLVDKPGAAQSMIRVFRWVGDRNDPERPALEVANMAWGGAFMGRLNMNLREEKGYTYGARSGFDDSLGGGVWSASTSVKSDVTDESLTEIFRELAAFTGEKPLTADELAYFKGSMLQNWPGRFETADFLLSKTTEIWRYKLPADWLSGYVARIEAVTLEQAQSAFTSRIATQKMHVVVVGDLASIRAPIEALNLGPVQVFDANAKVVK